MGCDCAKKKTKQEAMLKVLETQISVKEELIQALRKALARVKLDHEKSELEFRCLRIRYGA